MSSIIQVKRGTAAGWTSANPTLNAGEIGFETDTKKMKVGDGSTAWTSLTYTATDGDISGVTAGTGLSGGGNSGAVTLAIDTATVATLTDTQTFTNKTLTSPVVNTAAITGGTLVNTVIKGLEEDVNVVGSAATGTINFDVETASIWYYTSNASANHTLNFRYNSSTSLDSAMATGDAITLVWLNTNGETPYYPNTINIDGSAVSPKVPAAISAGNASSIDAYSFTIIKTASATFTVLETQTKFA